MSFTPLSSEKHSHLHLAQGTLSHLHNRPCVPLGAHEAQQAGLDLPLAFTRSEAGLSLVAVLSLSGTDNAQVGPKGLWMGGYMPAVIQAYPFALAYRDDKATVVVDEQSDFLSPNQGQLLFDLDGSLSEALQKKINFLKTKGPNPHRDGPVLQAIDTSGVLEPWEEVSRDLLRVSREKLNAFSDEQFLQLRRALPVVFAQVASETRLKRIQNLAQRKQKIAERQSAPKQKAADEPGLRFDDDIFKFDNI